MEFWRPDDPRHGAERESEFVPRVLIVEDEPRLRATLKLMLQEGAREVDDCGTGTEALALFARKSYDLMLLDLGLPDLSGLEVLDRLAGRVPSLSVIVISANDTIDAAIGALRRGAYDFVRKPYEAEELLRTVDNALQRRRLERTNALISGKLLQSERLHRYLIDHSPDIIYTADEQGRFTYLNPAISQMIGYERDELIGRHYTDIIHEEDTDRARYAFGERRTGERASRNVELRLRRKNGPGPDQDVVLTVALSASGVYSGDVRSPERRFIGTYGVARDITDRKRAEERISFQAYHDLLTQLPNRSLFKDRLGVAMTQAQRNRHLLAVLFIDLDRFKIVNDTLGHAAGDELLKSVASRLTGCLRRTDTLARLGGDEFTILLSELSQPGDAALIAEKVIEELRRPLRIAGHEIRAAASIGLAIYPTDGSDVDTLIKHADIAMYHVKSAAKDGYAFFSLEMNAAFHHRLEVETELRRALEEGELELRYQPQVRLSARQIVGMEALVRWRHPQRGMLEPADFVPVAEEAGLISRLSDWVLDQACQRLAQWRQMGFDQLRIAVNLSPRDFEKGDVFDRVFAVLRQYHLPPDRLAIEITENLLMRDIGSVIDTVSRLRASGVRVSIDDFGTRYASFGYLQRFSVSSLKIDQTFVHALSADRPHNPIIVAIVGIARGFNLHLIAEGVESPLQRDILNALGCDEMQGFLFGKPLEAGAASEALQRGMQFVPS